MLCVGTVLHGTYRIDGYLSSGGFGNTYLATNIQFEERYAIKEFFMRGVSERSENSTTVSVSNADNQATFVGQLEKFKKEARRLRKLHNEHIVQVFDLFEENGTAYYVMEYIDGENLSERLKLTGRPMTEEEVMELLPQILDALSCAHQEGILHLDLKPANIMVNKQGEVKLIDFGASKQQSATVGATTSTAVSYTSGYAPREQMEQNPKKFGPWTDFYALGATLYNLLTNRTPPLPSDIDDDKTLGKRHVLPMPSNVSEEMRDFTAKLMTTDQSERPKSVSEILHFLTALSLKSDEEENATKIILPKDAEVPHEGSDMEENEHLKSLRHGSHSKRKIILTISIVIVVGICSVIIAYTVYRNGSNTRKDISVATTDTTTDTTTAVTPSTKDTLNITTEKTTDTIPSTNIPSNIVEDVVRAKSLSTSETSYRTRDIRPRTVKVGRKVTTSTHVWTLQSIELHSDLTIVKWKVVSRTDQTGIWNDGNEKIIDRNTGSTYGIIDSNGIGTESNPTVIPYAGQMVEFEEFFPALPQHVESIDYDMGHQIIRRIQL